MDAIFGKLQVLVGVLKLQQQHLVSELEADLTQRDFLENTLQQLQTVRVQVKQAAMQKVSQQLDSKRAMRLASREHSFENTSVRGVVQDKTCGNPLYRLGSQCEGWSKHGSTASVIQSSVQVLEQMSGNTNKKKSQSISGIASPNLAMRLGHKPTGQYSNPNSLSKLYGRSDATYFSNKVETPTVTDRSQYSHIKPRIIKFEEPPSELSYRSGSVQRNLETMDYVLYSQLKQRSPQPSCINISEMEQVSQPTPELAKGLGPFQPQMMDKENRIARVSKLEWSFRPKEYQIVNPPASQSKTPDHRALGFVKKSLGNKCVDMNASSRLKRNSFCTSGTGSHANTANNSFANLSGISAGMRQSVLHQHSFQTKPGSGSNSTASVLRCRLNLV